MKKRKWSYFLFFWIYLFQDLSQDVLIQSFNDLKDVLNQIGDLKELDPNHYFDPFLEVIRAGGTSGSITSLALSSVQKFLSYGLIGSYMFLWLFYYQLSVHES